MQQVGCTKLWGAIVHQDLAGDGQTNIQWVYQGENSDRRNEMSQQACWERWKKDMISHLVFEDVGGFHLGGFDSTWLALAKLAFATVDADGPHVRVDQDQTSIVHRRTNLVKLV